MRREGQLKTGKKKFRYKEALVQYEGELDEQGRATGFGTVKYESSSTIEGMFYRDSTCGVATL